MGVNSKVILYIAMSLDGYIARKDGNIDWLENMGDGLEGTYFKFYNTIDTIVMGKKTYDQILTFGEWAYEGKNTYVLTSNNIQRTGNKNIQFRNEDIEELIRELKQNSDSNIWLLGGSEVINSFLDKDLIDEFRITIIPVILGSGIRLFTVETEKMLELKEVKEYERIVELKYRKKEMKTADFQNIRS